MPVQLKEMNIMDTLNTLKFRTRIKRAISVIIRNGRSSQSHLGNMKHYYILIVVFFAILTQGLRAGVADDLLKSLVEKSRAEEASYADVKALRSQLQANHPNSDQAAIGEAVYMGFLCDDSGASRTDEMNGIFQTLRQKGESKWYVVAARIALMCAYSQESGKLAASKALAQEGMQLINVAELKMSYNNLIEMLKASCGAERFHDADADITAWMNALQSAANNDE